MVILIGKNEFNIWIYFFENYDMLPSVLSFDSQYSV